MCARLRRHLSVFAPTGSRGGAKLLTKPVDNATSAAGDRPFYSVRLSNRVKLMGNRDPASVAWAPDSPFRTRAIAVEYIDMSNGEFVHGYIQAVHDATEGKEWCEGKKVRPLSHELEDLTRRALQQMPDTQLKGNAADLIVELWAKKWPCTAGQRRRQ